MTLQQNVEAWPLEVVARQVWDFKEMPPEDPNRKPAKAIFFGTTIPIVDYLKDNCKYYYQSDRASSIEKVRKIHAFHVRANNDIRYSFMISEDGTVYEGSGWVNQPSLPRRVAIFPDSLYIIFLEPIPGRKPTKEMLEARHNLIKYGVANNFIDKNALEYFMDNRQFWKSFKQLLIRF